MKSKKKQVYLDMAATTPVSPSVARTISETMLETFGNPSSIHLKGKAAKDIIDSARAKIVQMINCEIRNEIIFTSGACEANSLAICGFLKAHPAAKLITTTIEHKSIRDICKTIPDRVIEIGVDSLGLVSVKELQKACSENPNSLVSIQAANGEIGVIQDLGAISNIAHKYNCAFHTDATQLFPYEEINVKSLGIDMMSVSGQKFGCPKGIGFLYSRMGIEIKPIIHGSQMEGRRGGTENVPYIAGLSTALDEISKYRQSWNRSKDKRNMFIQMLREEAPINIRINTPLDALTVPNTINVAFSEIDAESLIVLLSMMGVHVSAGSACNSMAVEPSETLVAIGVPTEYLYGTIRITFSPTISDKDISYAVGCIKNAVNYLTSKKNL